MGSFGAIVTTILLGAVAVGGLLMSAAAQEAHHFACLLFLLADFFAATCFVVWFKQRTVWDGMAITKAVCLAGFILAAMPVAIYYSWNSADAQPAQNNSSNQGIITNNQSGGSNTVNNYKPADRLLTPFQSSVLTKSLRNMQAPLLFIYYHTDPETNVYATQVLAAVKNSGVSINTLELGWGTSEYGVEVYPNGNDPTLIESALTEAKIGFKINYDSLPEPDSVLEQYKNYVGLLVGLRSNE